MVWYILLGILIFLLFALIVFIFSTIEIAVVNFSKSNYDKETDQITKKDFQVVISLYFLSKIKIFEKHMNSQKMKELYSKQQLEKIDFDNIKQKLPDKKVVLEYLKKLKINIKKLDLNLQLGTEDVLLTTGIIFIIATTLSILLSRIIIKYDSLKHQYKIVPIYRNQNLYKIDLDCIIQVKMVHIIYMIVKILKRKERKENGRTSNRRTYGYSYE